MILPLRKIPQVHRITALIHDITGRMRHHAVSGHGLLQYQRILRINQTYGMLQLNTFVNKRLFSFVSHPEKYYQQNRQYYIYNFSFQ